MLTYCLGRADGRQTTGLETEMSGKVTFHSVADFADFCACLVRQGVTFTGEQLNTNEFVVTFTGGF